MMDGWKRVQDSNHDSSLSRAFSKFLQVSESALVHVVVTSQRALYHPKRPASSTSSTRGSLAYTPVGSRLTHMAHNDDTAFLLNADAPQTRVPF